MNRVVQWFIVKANIKIAFFFMLQCFDITLKIIINANSYVKNTQANACVNQNFATMFVEIKKFPMGICKYLQNINCGW